jgi:hypothetical protein
MVRWMESGATREIRTRYEPDVTRHSNGKMKVKVNVNTVFVHKKNGRKYLMSYVNITMW